MQETASTFRLWAMLENNADKKEFKWMVPQYDVKFNLASPNCDEVQCCPEPFINADLEQENVFTKLVKTHIAGCTQSVAKLTISMTHCKL